MIFRPQFASQGNSNGSAGVRTSVSLRSAQTTKQLRAVPEPPWLAVWSRREACAAGAVYDAAEQPSGWSAQQAARELRSHGTGTLVTADGSTPSRFTIEPPTGLVCLEGDPQYSPELSFEVTGRLEAVASDAPAPLEHLDASARFLLRVRSAPDGALQRLRWEPHASFGSSQPLSDFTATTGLELKTVSAEPLFVWSWQGASTRGDAGSWTTTGQFLVRAAHEEEGKICQGMFEPPPGTRPPSRSARPFRLWNPEPPCSAPSSLPERRNDAIRLL
jgi:hypothetical protein